jgi:hypothetical protein
VDPRLRLAFAAAALSGCLDRRVEAEGQFGRPIPLADGAGVPTLAFRDEACPGTAGGCPSWCVDRPERCREVDPSACLPILVDSGSPLTILPAADGRHAVARECIEVRAAAGLSGAPGAEALAAAVARFRFLDPPVVRAPGDEVAGWTWDVGADQERARVGAVLGGSTLRHFAVALRTPADAPASVAFFRHYPGDEGALADQGRAYLRLQFPGRLLGRQVTDRCEFEGIDCELAGLDLRPDEEELVYESTRMLVDACLAPPPCMVVFQADPDDPAADPQCRSSPGGPIDAAQTCVDATDPQAGGVSASLVVATGIPDLVLFDDSAARFLGDLATLPACPEIAAGGHGDARACRDGEDSTLYAAGWPAMTGLSRLRVRALGIVPGNSAVAGPGPCERLERRLAGSEAQCEDYVASGGEPREPLLDGAHEGARVDHGALVVGEVARAPDALEPDTSRWLVARIVPATAPMALALRRDVGSQAVQPDGVVGTALLAGTETVLDYTEEDRAPGLRVACLDPGPSCLSIPTCAPVDPDAPTREPGAPPGRVGRVGCCFGLPQAAIARAVRSGAGKDPPRIEEACCAALAPATLAALVAETGLCAGVDPL